MREVMRAKFGLPVLLALIVTLPAVARVEQPLRYTKTQSFSTALRYLRVDNGFEVVEKDKENGYLLFQYPKRSGGTTHGSIEVIQRDKSVALIVQLPKLPEYHEQHLADGLLKKLRQDYGEPPAPKEAEKSESDDRGHEPSPKEKPPERPPLPPGQTYPGSQ